MAWTLKFGGDTYPCPACGSGGLFVKIMLGLLFLLLPVLPLFAVDETASELIAFGQIRLEEINDVMREKYPGKKGVFWNIEGDAYHAFSKTPGTDVIIGLAGYQDVGLLYNAGRQLVKDAGAGFAYFHLDGGDWKLEQVVLVEGDKYEGFEGADLIGNGRDQLVVYSAEGVTQIANVYLFSGLPGHGRFEKAPAVRGSGFCPIVLRATGKAFIGIYQRALIKTGEEFQIYYVRRYGWDGKAFQADANGFLDRVACYDPVHPTRAESPQDLDFFDSYHRDHPGDFCALADCYSLSRRLGLKEKMGKYRDLLTRMGHEPVACDDCDDWIKGKNQTAQQMFMEWINSGGK